MGRAASGHLAQGTVDVAAVQLNHAIGGPGGAGVEHPQAVLQLLAQGAVGVAEEENVRLAGPGVGHGGVIAALYPLQVPVGEENAHPVQSDLFL